MKKQFILSGTFLVVLCAQTLFAQEFTVPTGIQLETAEDYERYESDVVDCVTWLEQTPVDKDSDKREKASAFLLLWATGTPSVTIQMQAFQLNLTKKNSSLLTNFIGGWVAYAIENPAEKTNVLRGNMAGIKSLIKVYSANKGKGMKKNKRLEQLVKMNETELEKWVRSQLE